ncbi:patatin-like phospholipase domain-containing protein 5 [Rousettus aegyptiacus]|uniref:patatin-like phospholipase domain-containing protein 5 n=1 Tax=Rousettus aegyptiacus TaxID=9407 RepID=UPI00168D15CC|nr:patatin-like phospholipase domain-containing protein 5 [Rousettus aegyptiacus]
MACCFQEEGSWNLSFSGAGFLGLYHVGVTQCLRERAPLLLQGAGRIYGSSSGALNAICVLLGKPIDFCCSSLLGLVHKAEQLSLGTFHPAFTPVEYLEPMLQLLLPPDAHILASQRLGISLTRWPGGDNFIVTEFASRDEVIQALICSTYFPFYCGIIPPKFRGQYYFDGALSNNLPFSEDPHTITVSPFTGTVDICPQSTSASFHELYTFNASFQISTMNLFQGFSSLLWPTLEMVADNCRQGYLDALKFLERRGLTKEPVLWTLVSKEPPAPADETWGAGHDRGQKAGLSLNWAVPNVTVKDVPNFEMLSPELETGLKRACMRDSSLWARCCQSSLGRVLEYLLLPCTLPFQYTYFQTRRLVLWLPDMPADLWRMKELPKGFTLRVYSRMKDQLLGLVSLPVTSHHQPEAAPPVDLAKKPGPAPPIRPLPEA